MTQEVTLQEVLDAREKRATTQRQLLSTYQKPLLCLTMNIAGPVKRRGLIDLTFRVALEKLQQQLETALLHQELVDANTGMEAILVCNCPAEQLKTLAVELETTEPVGRLYDMDVIGLDGAKLSRQTPRACVVCGGPVGPCARSRAHGLSAIQNATNALLEDFTARYLADLAVQALLDEANLTPKPGLVDQRNHGVHKDMNLELLHCSAKSLHPYFRQAVLLGLRQTDCMKELQQAGLQAEQEMLATTGGVSTHKSVIYLFGLFLAALGSMLERGGSVFDLTAALARCEVTAVKETHGALAAKQYGASGARGEALAGFPHVRSAQRILRQHDGDAITALLMLLSQVEDTNVLYRGGTDGLHSLQLSAAAILKGDPSEYKKRLIELDDFCIAKNLSPGECGDLLALALLLDSTKHIWNI